MLNKMGTIGKKVVQEVLGGQGNNPPIRKETIPTFGRGGAARPRVRVYGAIPMSNKIRLRVKSMNAVGMVMQPPTITVNVNTSVTKQNECAHTLSDSASSNEPSTCDGYVFVGLPEPEMPSPTRYTTTSLYENRSHSHGRMDFLSMATRSRSCSREPSPIPPVPPLPRSASLSRLVDDAELTGRSRSPRRRVPARLALSQDLFQPQTQLQTGPSSQDDQIGHARRLSASVVFPPTPSSGEIVFRPFTRSNTLTTTQAPPPRRRSIDGERGRSRRRDHEILTQTRSLSITANDGSDETRRFIEEEYQRGRTSRPLPKPPSPIPPLPLLPADLTTKPSLQSMRFDWLGDSRHSVISATSSDFPVSLPSFVRPGSSRQSPSPHFPSSVSPPSTIPINSSITGLFTVPSSANQESAGANMQIQQTLELLVAVANINIALTAPLFQAQQAPSAPPSRASGTDSTESLSNFPLLNLPPQSIPTSNTQDTIPPGAQDSQSQYLRNSLGPGQQTPTPPGSPRLPPSRMATRISTPSSGALGPPFRLSLFPEGTLTNHSTMSSPEPIPPMPTLPWTRNANLIDTRTLNSRSPATETAPPLSARPHSWIGEVRGWDELEKGVGLGILVDDFGREGHGRDAACLSSSASGSSGYVTANCDDSLSGSGGGHRASGEFASLRSQPRGPRRALPKTPDQLRMSNVVMYRNSVDSSNRSFASFCT